MKKKLVPLFSLILMFAGSILALPLTVIIFQESGKLAKRVESWNKQCGGKPYDDEPCAKKRAALSADLGKFVACVNDELIALRGPISPDCPADLESEMQGRKKIMELEVRSALHEIKCLGLPESDDQCAGEALAIKDDKASLRPEYKETHARFDGTWISLPISKIEKKK